MPVTPELPVQWLEHIELLINCEINGQVSKQQKFPHHFSKAATDSIFLTIWSIPDNINNKQYYCQLFTDFHKHIH